MLCEVQSCVFGIVTLKHGIWVKYESIVTLPCVIKFTSLCPLSSKSTNRLVWSCFGLFLLVNSVWSVHIYFCWFRQDDFFTEATNIMDRGLAFTFMHLADAFIQSDLQLHSGYTFLISMCVPWESNPQPFALLMQCSNTDPHRIISAGNNCLKWKTHCTSCSFSQDIDGLEWCGLLQCFYPLFGLILTAPIHRRGAIGEQVMQCYISPNLMKKQTHQHLAWPECE